jgi:transitional endoplasmic reticulum ATPase
MDFAFSIRFGKRPLPEYQTAREYASKFRRFFPAKEGTAVNVLETSNKEVLAKFEVFVKLMETIRDWDSTRVIVGVLEMTPAEFQLPEKQEIAACYHRYLDSESKEAYCDDKRPDCWGCRKLNGIILRHDKQAFDKYARYWYQYGKFTDKTTWRISREELTLALEEIVKTKCIDFCPAFENVFFRRYIAALPLLVHMADTRSWSYVYNDDATNSAKRWEPVNIRHLLPSSETGGETTGDGKAEQDGPSTASGKGDDASDADNIRYVPPTTFADIGGVDEIIQNIRIMIELPIIKPQLYDYLGIAPYRGILLWGDPGNGKTLIAKAIAHEVKAHFIPVAGPDILNRNFGQSEQNLRKIFEEAREHQPSVIFIDEIDSIAQTRLAGESAKWYATVVNQLLSLMDGIRDYGNITVLASTNRPDLLDAALLRPGRFDYKLEIKKPNLPGCKRVLEIATRDMPLADDVDLFAFSESVIGYSAAELTFLAKEAAMVALRKAVETNAITMEADSQADFSFIKITMADFKAALHLLKWNRRYVNLSYSLKDKKLT